MTADVTKRADGRYEMASVREMPWHRLVQPIADFPQGWGEMRKAAGLEWDAIEEPQFRLTGMDAGGQATYEQVEGYKFVVRSDNSEILASANDTYELISMSAMGEIAEAILEVPDVEVKYETAGSLFGGRKVWALAQLGDVVEIPGDSSPTIRYLALMNSFDGTSAFKAVGTGVRIVCANTWHAADMNAERTGTAYSFRHTKNWKKRVEEARLAVTGAYAQMDKLIAKAKELMEVRVNTEQIDQFINAFAVERTLLNTDVKRKNLEDHVKTNPRVAESLATTKHALKTIIDSETCADLKPTAYMLVQAAGEFADHWKPAKSDDTHFTRTMIGIEPLKKIATKLAVSSA